MEFEAGEGIANGSKDAKKNLGHHKRENEDAVIIYDRKHKNLSTQLSECMDQMGYSFEQAKYRRYIRSEIHKYETYPKRKFCYEHITTGSKAEGCSFQYESDTDRMIVIEDIECLEEIPSEKTHINKTTLHVDFKTSSPGYVYLELLNLEANATSDIIEAAIEAIDDKRQYQLLSSENFITEMSKKQNLPKFMSQQVRSGPSLPARNPYELSVDEVFCFKCFCPNYLSKWSQRPRSYGWPDASTLDMVTNLEGHVVPTGNKTSLLKNIEWRLCFTKAEIALVNSFNDTQIKLYVLLKQISKDIFKSVCNEMTSYVIKNVIFWMAERRPPEVFCKERLLETLGDSMRFLKKCLKSNRLESFMIPERNLLHGRVDNEQTRQLIKIIDDSLVDDATLLQRCGKFYSALKKMQQSPIEFIDECQTKRDVEHLLLEGRLFKNKFKCKQFAEEERDIFGAEYEKLRREIERRVLPNWQEENNVQESFARKMIQLLS